MLLHLIFWRVSSEAISGLYIGVWVLAGFIHLFLLYIRNVISRTGSQAKRGRTKLETEALLVFEGDHVRIGVH